MSSFVIVFVSPGSAFSLPLLFEQDVTIMSRLPPRTPTSLLVLVVPVFELLVLLLVLFVETNPSPLGLVSDCRSTLAATNYNLSIVKFSLSSVAAALSSCLKRPPTNNSCGVVLTTTRVLLYPPRNSSAME